MLSLLCLLSSLVACDGLEWKRMRGGILGSKKEEAAGVFMQKSNATTNVAAVLSVVPVFALTDGKGRPVLVQQNESAAPVQLWFTDVNVARIHAGEIQKVDAKLQLKIAMSNLDQVRIAGNGTQDREVRVCADPREVHVARQLLLRAAGFVNLNDDEEASPRKKNVAAIDFSNETLVMKAAQGLQKAIGVDFEKDVPLFTLAALNATVGAPDSADNKMQRRVVQPWFMSFADLVRAYVNSTVPKEISDDDYKIQAQKALENVLKVGQTAVTTLDKLVASVENGNNAVFIMPPASSVDAISKARLEQRRAEESETQGGLLGETTGVKNELFDDDSKDDDPGLFG